MLRLFADQCRMFYERNGIVESIKAYVMALTSAAIVCGILCKVVGEKDSVGVTLKLVTGIFILFTAISPLINIHISNLGDFLNDFVNDSDQYVFQGTIDAQNVLREIITQKTSTYIMDKGRTYGAELHVEVKTDDSDIPVPCAVTISGAIAPYAKSQLQTMIREDLGIAMEAQTWIY